MRVTKRQLRRIIQRELLVESSHRGYSLADVFYEQAQPEKIDTNLYPTKLSQVDKELAKKLAVSGLEDGSEEDDHADVEKDSMAADTLKATQSTMDLGKFVGMAIQMMGKIGNFSSGAGGDLGAIISSDNHIMDGHHRWAATLMADPSAEVGGIKIDLPGEKLVGVLNVWTAARKGDGGKPSTHKMNDLTPDVVADAFKELVNSPNKFLPSTEEMLAAFKENGFDSLDAAAAHVEKNWSATSALRKVESWMPEKPDMPAIEETEIAQVKSDIESGKMDLNEPYGFEEGGESEATNESANHARWARLAGLLKG